MAQPPQIFDRPLIARRMAARPDPGADFVTALVLDDLQDRLLTVSRGFEQALIMAPDAAPLPHHGETRNAVFAYERVATLLPHPEHVLVDPENLVLPRRDYDLIVSVLDLAIINDVPGFLARLRAHLRNDGLFLAVTLGGATLTELREAFVAADALVSGGAQARVAPFLDIADAGALLQRAGFALPVADLEDHVVRYVDPIRLFAELKALGASNPLADRHGTLMSRGLLATATAEYQRLATDADGKVRASLQLAWMSGWAPDESQQKPLRPGSATISLAEALRKTQG